MRKSLILIIAGAFALGSVAADAGWNEGVAAFKAKNYQQAVTEFQTVVDQGGDYRGHYMLGMSLQRLNRKEEALRHLRQAYDLNPNDVAVKLELGKAYLAVRKYDEVARLLDTVDTAKLPATHQPVVYQMRAQAKAKVGNESGALADFKKLVQLKPNDANFQYSYGSLAFKADQLDTAISALRKAVQLDGSDANKKTVLANALIKKGRLTRDKAAKRNVYRDAAKFAAAVVAAKPTFDNLMLQLSAELGAADYLAAVETAKKAQAKNGTDWLVPFYMGQAYTSAGQFAEAEAPLNKAFELARSQDDKNKVQRQRGFTFEKQKRWNDAIAAYQSAGDSASAARVTENRDTEEFNKNVEAENERIRAMQEEAKRLEEEMKALEEGGG